MQRELQLTWVSLEGGRSRLVARCTACGIVAEHECEGFQTGGLAAICVLESLSRRGCGHALDALSVRTSSVQRSA